MPVNMHFENLVDGESLPCELIQVNDSGMHSGESLGIAVPLRRYILNA